ncbi:MAG: right-handed parallel beta-helix repeat-containing protein, partial [Candidatus Eisenbacteria bacterium]|nr:right-handed parallel beta-helix repeat-containing protein [Candidatus Eisenbacteria bacterium]
MRVHFAFILLAIIPAPGSAMIYNVPSSFSTIQAGLDAATAGDSVLVAAGIYAGNGNNNLGFAGKDIVLISEEGAAATIIDCQGEHFGIYFQNRESRNCIVDGFTIRGADRTAIVFGNEASSTVANCILKENTRGLSCSEASSCMIDNCLILSNGRGDGAGIYISHSSPEVKNSIVSGNRAPEAGGGILVGNGSTLRLDGCLINGCFAAGMGGGIFCGVDASALISNCTISGNAAINGGGLITGGGFIQLENSVVWGNFGGMVISNGSATISCSVVDTAEIVEWGISEIEYIGANVFSDPLFCYWIDGGYDPTSEGDYRVESSSPCLPENNPCGVLIGGLGVGCDLPDPTIQRSWGL